MHPVCFADPYVQSPVMTFLAGLVGLVYLVSLVGARIPDGRLNGNMARMPLPPKITQNELLDDTTIYNFNQLIDHNNPSLGTFSQRYWLSSENYKPGGPIILITSGEDAADGYTDYLTGATITGTLAEQQNGAVVLIEHRFYGESNPYGNLSVASFEVHTIQQAIDDFVYFANNVNLSMPGGGNVTPSEAPWIMVGGSYSGALTSFTLVNQPDVFYAGWASSAVVESIVDYWGYWEPIRVSMPQNCSKDVEAVIDHIDTAFTSGTSAEIDSIKKLFNMNLSHLDDFAGALRNNLFDWQYLQPYSDEDRFFNFCDALEVKDGVNAPAGGWGLEHALSAWGSYWANTYFSSLCGDLDAESCLGTYNASAYTDISVNNAERSWQWTICNYIGFLQDGAPAGKPTIVSRLVSTTYSERICTYYFPEKFSSPPTPDAAGTNKAYDGWFVKADRLFFANGLSDPWLEATVSANGTNFKSTSTQPIAVTDAGHASDLLMWNSINPSVTAAQNQGLAAMKAWLADWKPRAQR
ncbi:peptidase S28 [Amylocystis lapponica]|nr:peptidase S28 [Amylocystis lapponica]